MNSFVEWLIFTVNKCACSFHGPFFTTELALFIRVIIKNVDLLQGVFETLWTNTRAQNETSASAVLKWNRKMNIIHHEGIQTCIFMPHAIDSHSVSCNIIVYISHLRQIPFILGSRLMPRLFTFFLLFVVCFGFSVGFNFLKFFENNKANSNIVSVQRIFAVIYWCTWRDYDENIFRENNAAIAAHGIVAFD